MKPSLHLLLIDPQNDFCLPNGALSVPGAEEDMARLIELIDRRNADISRITVTLDSHRRLDISHPLWWRDSEGNPPAPFTTISSAEVQAAHWQATDPSAQLRSLQYLETLESTGSYPHVIWPEHCLLGDPGHNVYGPLSSALHRWEAANHTGVDFLLKGSNPWTEHFSAVRAEVPDPRDPGTDVDPGFVNSLAASDELWIAGQALSHCVANTVRDLLAQPPFAGSATPATSMVLLRDATSPVPGFEPQAQAFVAEAESHGVRIASCQELLG